VSGYVEWGGVRMVDEVTDSSSALCHNVAMGRCQFLGEGGQNMYLDFWSMGRRWGDGQIRGVRTLLVQPLPGGIPEFHTQERV